MQNTKSNDYNNGGYTMKIKINTSDITVGQRIKNFKELCSVLHIPKKYQTCGGDQRKNILRDIQRYMKYERSGQAYIVQEIYETPIPKIDNRVRGIYLDNIEPLLYCILYEDSQHNGHRNAKKKKCVKTLTRWCQYIGLCNSKYKNDTYIRDFFKKKNINYITKNHFYCFTDDRMRKVLYSSLNSLKKREIIEYADKIQLCFEDFKQMTIDKEIEKNILPIEQEVMKEMGANSLFQLKMRGLSKSFYNRVTDKLKEKANNEKKFFIFKDLDFYYRVIEITYSPSVITDHYNKLQDNFNIEQALANNNKNIIHSLKQQYEKYPVLNLDEAQHQLLLNEFISI